MVISMPPIFKQTTYAAKHKCDRKGTQKSTILRSLKPHTL